MNSKSRFLLLFFLTLIYIFSLIPTSYAETQIDVPPYPYVNYDYTTSVKPGTIRYMSQISGSSFFYSAYWGEWISKRIPDVYYGPGYECGTCSMSMALSYIGINKTPEDILSAHNGVTYWTGWGADHSQPSIEEGISRYTTGNGKYSPLVLKLPGGGSDGNDHFVAAVGKNGSTLTILDPARDSIMTATVSGSNVTYQTATYYVSETHQWYNSSAQITPSSYLDKCTVYPTNLTVKTTSETNLKSLPCSWNTDNNSATLATIPSGKSFTVSELYRNEVDNWDSCWYKATYNGQEGYIFSGNTSVASYGGNTVSCSGGNPIPTTLSKDGGYWAAWLVESSHLNLDTISGYIYDSNGNALPGYPSEKTDINAKTYQMGAEHGYEPIDSNLHFSTLDPGYYSFALKVKCIYYYGDGNGNLQTKATDWTTPISFNFTKLGDTTAYLSKCTVYPTNLTVKTTSETNLKSLPCSWNTDNNSATLAAIPVGTSFTVTELYRNEVDNYDSCWYRATYNGQEGFIFSGNTSVTNYGSNTVTASGGTNPPSALGVGQGYYAAWLLSSDYLNIDGVFGFIYDEIGNTLSGYPSQMTGINAKTYQLGSENGVEPVDSGLHFSMLEEGHYSCKISVRCLYYYGGSDGSLQTKQSWSDPISWNFSIEEHVHDKGTYKYYWAAHPHYNCYECSVCGEIWEDRDSSNYLTTCDDCRPGKPAFTGMSELYEAGKPISFSWNPTEHTTHYNFYLYKEYGEGEYRVIERIMGNNETLDNPTIRTLDSGNYRVLVQAYDNQHWLSDHSDWAYTESDFVYFAVRDFYTITFDTNGGSEIMPITQAGGTAITAPTNPTKDGFRFVRWEPELPTTMPEENLTLTALYVPVYSTPDFTLPASIQEIEANAFEGAAMTVVYISDSCTSIGVGAFKNCKNLTQIRLPKNCAIDASAFAGCTSLTTVFAPAGGTTETWCGRANIQFVPET